MRHVGGIQLEEQRRVLQELDTDLLDRAAFGHFSGEVCQVDPENIAIVYEADLENALAVLEYRGSSWAVSVDLSEPIDLSIGQDGLYRLEDGHHRWVAARERGDQLTARIEIEGNPVEKLLDSDEHRQWAQRATASIFRMPDSAHSMPEDKEAQDEVHQILMQTGDADHQYLTNHRGAVEDGRFEMVWGDEGYCEYGDPYEVASRAGIYIDRSKEFFAGHVDEETRELVSSVFISLDGGDFAFDTAVIPEHQKRGLGTELIEACIDEFKFLESEGIAESMKLDVVNPIVIDLLKRHGLEVEDTWGEHIIMVTAEEVIEERAMRSHVRGQYRDVQTEPEDRLLRMLDEQSGGAPFVSSDGSVPVPYWEMVDRWAQHLAEIATASDQEIDPFSEAASLYEYWTSWLFDGGSYVDPTEKRVLENPDQVLAAYAGEAGLNPSSYGYMNSDDIWDSYGDDWEDVDAEILAWQNIAGILHDLRFPWVDDVANKALELIQAGGVITAGREASLTACKKSLG